jgi:hypothetical protein
MLEPWARERSITCALTYPAPFVMGLGFSLVPNGYIAVGWLLFLQEQIKVVIIINSQMGQTISSYFSAVCDASRGEDSGTRYPQV